MKKIVAMAFAAATFVACNSTTTGDNDMDRDTTSVTTTTTSTSDNSAYAPGDGDVTRRDGKVMVYRNGQWVESNEDVRMDNDVMVTRNGRVVREDKEIELKNAACRLEVIFIDGADDNKIMVSCNGELRAELPLN